MTMLPFVHAFLYSLCGVWLLTGVGNWICRTVFSLTGLKDAVASLPSNDFAAGWIIGWLERTIIAIGIVAHSWEVLAAVIALKTVARFKELDEQVPAEYFLVGSLLSLLWAILITGLWIGYDRHFGIDLRHQIQIETSNSAS